jgi:hypothetical protein
MHISYMAKKLKSQHAPRSGRPKGPERPVSLSIRFTEEEKAFLDQAAVEAGIGLAEYIRLAIEVARPVLRGVKK